MRIFLAGATGVIGRRVVPLLVNEHARKDLNWAPAYPSWREGFAALALGG